MLVSILGRLSEPRASHLNFLGGRAQARRGVRSFSGYSRPSTAIFCLHSIPDAVASEPDMFFQDIEGELAGYPFAQQSLCSDKKTCLASFIFFCLTLSLRAFKALRYHRKTINKNQPHHIHLRSISTCVSNVAISFLQHSEQHTTALNTKIALHHRPRFWLCLGASTSIRLYLLCSSILSPLGESFVGELEEVIE